MKNTYQIGDKVRLVSKRNSDWKTDGSMDYLLGSEQTIKDIEYNSIVDDSRVHFEDKSTEVYYWSIDDIECKVSDEVEFQQGEIVLVWDVDSRIKKERIFIAKVQFLETEFPYIVIDSSGGVSTWKNCEKLSTPPPLELTIEEIAEKFGVNPEQIKIK